MLLKVKQPIVVEGKYDRIKLASVIDGIFIETGGFRVFKDKELLLALKAVAKRDGIIILTDSDGAGFKIRNFLKSSLGKDAKIIDVYIPNVKGVEKRKLAPSAEGILGVEGIEKQMLIDAFARAGVGCEEIEAKSNLTMADFFAAGLTGGANSSDKKRIILEKLQLPLRLSNKTALLMLNNLLTREEWEKLLKETFN